MAALGLSARQLSLRAKLNETAVKAILAGRSVSPRYTTLQRLAAVLGCTPADLTGDHQPRRAMIQAGPRETLDFAGEAYSAVPVYDIRAAAGAGALNGDEAPETFGLHRTQWLSRLTRASLDVLALITVAGDSMWETLHDGDQVLVDRSVRIVGRDGIYVIRLGDELQVKRVSRHPATKRLTVTSDNPRYPTYSDVDPEALDVIGRVVWLGRNLG